MTDETDVSRDGGPWVVLAAFCERVITDNKGVLSLIQVLDRIVLSTNDPALIAEPVAFGIEVESVILLSAEPGQPPGTLWLVVTSPNGESLRSFDMPVHFAEGSVTTRVSVELNMSFKWAGDYWIDVIFDDRRLTRVPIRVDYRLDTPTTPVDMTVAQPLPEQRESSPDEE